MKTRTGRASAAEAAVNRQAVLNAATQLLREKGPDGFGVVEVCRAADLTHGGFYGQFASKQALIVEAIGAALESMVNEAKTTPNGFSPELFLQRYLSEDHVDAIGQGCPIAAMTADIARLPVDARGAFAKGLSGYLEAASGGDSNIREEVLLTLSRAVGALIIARAVRGADDALMREILSKSGG